MSARGPFQPFQCLICQSRFTRHENLKRHALLHSRSEDEALLPCELCQATFSRPDLRNRHMKRKHPGNQDGRGKRVEIDSATECSDESVSEIHGLHPDESISALMQQAMSEPRIDRIGQDVMDLQALLKHGHPSPGFTSFSFCDNDDDWSPSTAQIARGCELFFAHVSHFVPFLHQPTFDSNQAPLYLLLSMLSLAYQYGNDPENPDESGADLSKRCFHRARALTSDEDISAVQSYLLLQICAMMYLCGQDSSHGLKMHSAMISLARSTGLMHPTTIEPSTTQDLDTLWHSFIQAESHKRTLFAVHQIDALWYQFLSIPRSISHLEIKHDLPCPRDHWTASSPAEWAHRQLIQKQGPAMQYADAVRAFLSQDSDTSTSLPPFDPYGAINITQFLISSAREISGWSTMTGMLSIDRFGALRSSLVALKPFINPTSSPTSTENSTLSTATWQTAMIELQIWSPSHTSGIVEASIDAVLSQSTYLSPSPSILCEDLTAKAIQPHID